MSGKFLRAFGFAVAMLLFAQGSALSAILNVTEVDEFTLTDSNISADFVTLATIGNDIDDYYLINYDLTVEDGAASTVILSAPENLPENFELSFYEVNSGSTGNYDATLIAGPELGSLTVEGLVSGNQYLLNVFFDADNGDVSSYGGKITATPLPPALLIFGTGLLGLGMLSRYRRRRQGQLGLQA